MRARLLTTSLTLALVGLLLSGPTPSAKAATILVFGQTSTNNTVTSTNNGAGSTTLSASGVPVLITAFANGGTPISAFFALNATSVGAATVTATGGVTQHFTGSFSITNGATNYLSGTFTDSVFGSGASLTLSAAQPPDSVSFTSNVLSPSLLGTPRGITLAFTNVTPPVTIVNNSLSSFTASVGGNFSATPVVPEPATIGAALSVAPVLGLFWMRRRRQA